MSGHRLGRQPQGHQRAHLLRLPCGRNRPSRAIAAPKLKPATTSWPIEFAFQPVKRGRHIAASASPSCASLAQTRPAEVESQNRQSQPPLRRVQHLHRVVDHLVVHRAPALGMRMANQRRKGASAAPSFKNASSRPAGPVRRTLRSIAASRSCAPDGGRQMWRSFHCLILRPIVRPMSPEFSFVFNIAPSTSQCKMAPSVQRRRAVACRRSAAASHP